MVMSDFLAYYCDRCDLPYCERVSIMNLALGNVDDAYCLLCLANEYDQAPQQMAQTCWGYVSARDCFKDPWLKVDPSLCPNKKPLNVQVPPADETAAMYCYCDIAG